MEVLAAPRVWCSGNLDSAGCIKWVGHVIDGWPMALALAGWPMALALGDGWQDRSISHTSVSPPPQYGVGGAAACYQYGVGHHTGGRTASGIRYLWRPCLPPYPSFAVLHQLKVR